MMGLIITVGNSYYLTEYSIKEIKPEYICFLTTQKNISNVVHIKNTFSLNDNNFRIFVVDNLSSADISQKLNQGITWLLNKELKIEDIVLDNTSGSPILKNVVSMVTGSLGINIYVPIISGRGSDEAEEAEYEILEIKNLGNIYNVSVLPRLKNLIDNFNAYNYEESIATLELLGTNASKLFHKKLFEFIILISRAYQKWNLFDYATANDLMNEGMEVLQDLIVEKPELNSLLREVHQNKSHFEQLLGDSRGCNDPCVLLAVDLFCDGLRKMNVGNHSDAAVRFYRVVELVFQTRLLSEYGILSGEVDLVKIPVGIQQSFQKESGRPVPEKLALNDCFTLLTCLGDPLSKEVPLDLVQGIQFVRNHSILAHGFRTLDSEEIDSMSKSVVSVLEKIMNLNGLIIKNLFKQAKPIKLSFEFMRSIL